MIPYFRDETYRDVKTLGYNIRGHILWGINVQGHNILGCIIDVHRIGVKVLHLNK
jgi:hypothetical protein